MKEIRTEDAVGHILCHDITQIIKDEKKGVLFKKGHVVKEEDIPLLFSVGKEHLFVWEKKPGILHENEAAEILYKICAGNSSKVHGTEIKEGKIEVVSKIDGILKIRRDALVAVNSLGEMMIASRHGDFPVKKGDKVAGTRIIPLVIEKEKMDFSQNVFLRVQYFNNQPRQLQLARERADLAQKRYDTSVEAFVQGKIDILNLNDARSSKDAALLNYIEQMHWLWSYYYQIRSLTLYDFIGGRPLTAEYDPG